MSILDNNGAISDPYRNFIAVSRYSRWIESENRRETWSETVKRYVDFMKEHMDTNYKGVISNKTWDKTERLILNHELVPSMRALMTAGPALARENLAQFNCSFIAVDDVRAFDEALYILMNGVGLGFSVEPQYVSQLPAVNEHFEHTGSTIVVADSKAGWARAFRELIALLYQGQIPRIDVSKVRPAGARLKTFGGRASGPQPLVDLFDYTIGIMKAAAGRQLTPREAHGILCKVGEVVVVGGVRRSALISQSSLNDYEMSKAKSGAWWEEHPEYALANNSAVYYKKPSIGEFLGEWGSLYESKSGERGIINMEGLRTSPYAPRRDLAKVQGLNPCLTADTWVMTSEGPRQIADIVEHKTELMLDGSLYDSTGFYWTGDKQVYKMTLANGMSVRATDNHQILTEFGWKELKDITVSDKVRLSQNQGHTWNGEGTESEGYLMGLLVGDGTFGNNACIDVWESSESIVAHAEAAMENAGIEAKFNLCTQVGNEKKWRASNRQLTQLAARFGLTRGNKTVTKQIQEASSRFYEGFLRGYFDADGSVQGSRNKGQSVRLWSTSNENLDGVQKMLSRIGIASNIYFDRTVAGKRLLPNNNRELALYDCKAGHELIISRQAIQVFAERLGFCDDNKQDRLESMLSGVRGLYKNSEFSAVSSIQADGMEDVYDATVPEVSAFDANGIYVHNCAEILLRSKQLCNLTEVVVRADDTLETLAEKVEIATILGTVQSSLTDFKYLRKIWKDNCEEERLLGVSLTGQFGHTIMNGSEGLDKLAEWLDELRNEAIITNADIADAMGINRSTAITTAKPSGTVSQLTESSSGMHPWHNEYYIRTVRADNKDPLTEFMKEAGIPWEPDVMKPDHTTVFSFPQKAPEGAVTRMDLTAIEHLNIWRIYKQHWTEHNPSVTINVREDEWIQVAEWVYSNWKDIGGISFLPYSEHTYRQAPYQDCTEADYYLAKADMPESIDWSMLSAYETEDTTVGSQTLSCSAGNCEVVDVTSK